MNATKPRRTALLGRFLGVAAGTFAVALVGIWPMTTEADDVTGATTEALQVAPNVSRVGAIEATARAFADDQDPKKWCLEVRFVNRNADQPESATFTEELQRVAVRSEASRVPNMPRAVWSTKEHIALGPGESKTVRHDLPDPVSAQLLAYATAQQQAKSSSPKAKAKAKARANTMVARADSVGIDALDDGASAPMRMVGGVYFRPMVFGSVSAPKAQQAVPARRESVQAEPVMLPGIQAQPKQATQPVSVQRPVLLRSTLSKL